MSIDTIEPFVNPELNAKFKGNNQQLDPRIIARVRRAFIAAYLNRYKKAELTFDKIEGLFPGTDDRALKTDAYEELDDCNVECDSDNRRFRYASARENKVGVRERQHLQKKRLIAQIACPLICSSQRQDQSMELPAEPFPPSEELRAKVRRYHEKYDRLVALDSGTTTGAIAKELAKTRTPNHFHCHLSIVTNGLGVLNRLAGRACTHDVIPLSGLLQRLTGAIVGGRAIKYYQSLEDMRVRPDLAIVGATTVNKRFEFCCSTSPEALVKQDFLASGIRAVAVDSHKLGAGNQTQEAGNQPQEGGNQPQGELDDGGAWVIAECDSSQIDIVITDSGIYPLDDDPRAEAKRQFLNHALAHGVFVLVGGEWGIDVDGSRPPSVPK